MLPLVIINNLFSYGGKICQILSKIIQMLARNLLCDTCANLIDFLKKIIFSENFLASNKTSFKNFTSKITVDAIISPKAIGERELCESHFLNLMLSVHQDFHARIFSKNLTAMLAFPTRRDIEQNGENKLYQYQINFIQAISKMRDIIVLLFNPAFECCKKSDFSSS